MKTVYTVNQPTCWDEAAKTLLDDEFLLDDLLRSQDVRSFRSIVYCFSIPASSEITLTSNTVEDAKTFKAPWEE